MFNTLRKYIGEIAIVTQIAAAGAIVGSVAQGASYSLDDYIASTGNEDASVRNDDYTAAKNKVFFEGMAEGGLVCLCFGTVGVAYARNRYFRKSSKQYLP